MENNKMTAKQAAKEINKNEDEYYIKMDKIAAKAEELAIAMSPSAPIFGLGKWRREHELVSPEMHMYMKAVAYKAIMYFILALFIGFEIAYLHYVKGVI